jgi:hypothetical protein
MTLALVISFFLSLALILSRKQTRAVRVRRGEVEDASSDLS